jgi:hypothetical protein
LANGYDYYSKAMKLAMALLLASLAFVHGQPPPAARALMEKMGRGEGSLKPGDPAPDFSLRVAKSGRKVRLSSFKGKRPVALVFGSYT